MVGVDHRSQEIRPFAVDRIGAIAKAGRRFVPRPDFDFDAYVGASFGVVHEPAEHVRILFEKEAAAYVSERTWHPSQKLVPAPGGAVELSMEVGGREELRSWVLSFGAQACVLEPAKLRAEVAREIEAARRRYAK